MFLEELLACHESWSPPTKAILDSRTSPHRHVYETLLGQYLDEGNNDTAMFAYPDHVFRTRTGVRLDIAFSDFNIAWMANDIAAILAYIKHHYQVAYQRSKQSGLHFDFENLFGQGTSYSAITSALTRRRIF